MLNDLIEYTVNQKASDLHFVVGKPPLVRVNGRLFPIPGKEVLTEKTAQELVFGLVIDEQKEILTVNKEIDFSFVVKGLARFRVNAYYQKGSLAAALRLIPGKIPTIENLGLPKILHQVATLKQGFVLITGPTGMGKTTTLASIVDEIARTRSEHIVTIEDPIEYEFAHQKSLISQREMKLDTHSWQLALKSVLREDPNVVMIGEMRDFETIAAALTIAETGHLVFATLHTNSAAQTIDRIVDVFPEEQQSQVRTQLASVLEAVFSQRLLPSLEGSRVPACEILLSTSAVQSTIRDGKTHMIDNIIQTSAGIGMQTLEMDLARLVRTGKIGLEEARSFALRPGEINKLVAKKS